MQSRGGTIVVAFGMPGDISAKELVNEDSVTQKLFFLQSLQ
jgi:hypothetical protein